MTRGTQDGRRVEGPRLIAIVGPFQSGKTTLLEAILARGGALSRQGTVREGTTAGDSSAEARAHAMSVEANVASIDFMGDRFTFVDCPGSVEFLHDMRSVLPLCDAAIVVCETDERKLPALQLILHEIEELKIPRYLFINKIDVVEGFARETLEQLQPASRTPLLLRQLPIVHNGVVSGYIDLALERAYVYHEHAPSTVIDLPSGELEHEKAARYAMLEKLADYDDALLEELVGEIEPPPDQIFGDLAKELRDGLIAPVMFGSAERGNGVTRLLKAIRHEVPGIAATRERLGVDDAGAPLAHAVRTIHTAHGGKLTLSRVLRGSFADGAVVISSRGGEDRIAGLSRLVGASTAKQPKVEEGDTLAFGRLEHVSTGDSFGDAKALKSAVAAVHRKIEAPQAVHAFALTVKDRNDEVRLASALAKLCEEDPSLVFMQDTGLNEMKLLGQGEMHLRITLERLAARFGVAVDASKPSVAYRETIRDAASVRGRHKKQSGGHGQFGDVALDVRPQERGAGFAFAETVHGGAVPRQYFSAIEHGCRDALVKGPLGFPVVDVAATLTDGSYHTVDSSDMAFRTAARMGLAEALAKARPILLEPILSVEIDIPSDAMSRASGLVSARRGHILGYDARDGWEGWDVLKALIPESEIGELIIELRSATSGVGSFRSRFDHLEEVAGKTADAIVAHARTAAAAH